MIIDILLLILSIVLLWKGSDKLVESAGRIAARLGVSELIIGLTIVAFGTSAPEFAVTVTAALKGISSISVGNIVGSNIFNLGFILGIVAVIVPVIISPKLVYRDGAIMIASTFILLFFFHDLTLSFMEGMTLILLLIVYLIFLFFRKEKFDTDEISQGEGAWKDWIILPVSIAVVVTGGHLLVNSGSSIARAAGISEWVIGVTIVAAGTSAPEMATSIAAVIKGRHGISAGNLIGSNIFNILGVLGIAGILRPLTIMQSSYYSLIMLMLMVIFAVLLMRTGWRISRTEGLLLILSGLALWIYDFIK
jgi:cation:H+ antiporter